MKLKPWQNLERGSTVEIVNPVSEMEKEMVTKYGIKQLTFDGWSKPHGYARCIDNTGAIWHIHP